jgi:hypothetical protein
MVGKFRDTRTAGKPVRRVRIIPTIGVYVPATNAYI